MPDEEKLTPIPDPVPVEEEAPILASNTGTETGPVVESIPIEGMAVVEGGESLQPSPALIPASSANKLDHAQQILVCQAFAEYCTLQQAADRLQAAGGPTLSLNGVLHYRDSVDWQPVIQELRAAWTARLGDCAGANKAIRLKELWRLYDGAVGGKHPARRDALACLEAIRREMEGPDRGAASSSEIKIILAQPLTRADEVA